MKKLEIFKPDDFDVRITAAAYSSEVANQKLNEWLEKQQVVYSGWHSHLGGKLTTDTWWTSYSDETKATHKALLINIEEIEKELCKHEIIEYTANTIKSIPITTVYCGLCGIKLKTETEKECKHTPKLITGLATGASLEIGNTECANCGIKIKLKWEPVE